MNNNIKLILEDTDGTIVAFEIPQDENIWGWATIFKTILTKITFANETINKILTTEHDDDTESYN